MKRVLVAICSVLLVAAGPRENPVPLSIPNRVRELPTEDREMWKQFHSNLVKQARVIYEAIRGLPDVQAGRVYLGGSDEYVPVNMDTPFSCDTCYSVSVTRSFESPFAYNAAVIAWFPGDADSFTIYHQVGGGDSGWVYWQAVERTQNSLNSP